MRTRARRFGVGGCLALIVALFVLGSTAPLAVLAAQISSPTAGEDAVYKDPDGRFTIPIPNDWAAEDHDDYVTIVTNDKKVSITLVVIPGTKASTAIGQALQYINPGSTATPLPTLMATPISGSDDVALYTYDDGSTSGQLMQAYAQRVDTVVFVLILQGDLQTIGLRQIQVDKIRYGIQVYPQALGSPVATPAA